METKTTSRIKCSCKNEYQDKKYGPGIRVHNKTVGEKRPDWRCTSCGAERNKGG